MTAQVDATDAAVLTGGVLHLPIELVGQVQSRLRRPGDYAPLFAGEQFFPPVLK